MTLSWSAADSNGAAIDRYQWRRRPGSAAWTRVAGGDSARTAAVTGLVNDSLYTFYLRARNRVGFGSADSVSATPRAPVNRAPTVTGPDSASVPEGGKGPWVVGSYTGSDPDAGDVLRWRLLGADAAHFQLTGSASPRSLAFRREPDYEIRKRYAVEVEVRDRVTGGLRDTAAVTVTVVNVRERGTLSLTPSSPRVGQTVAATLTDTDGGVKDTTWTWKRVSPGPGGAGSASVSQRRSQRPVTLADLGQRLRATVTYNDNQGADTATAITQAVQANVPSAPDSLGASPGDRQVTLSWSAADNNGAAIDRYEYRRRPGSQTWARAGGGKARKKTVTGLTNNTTYTFYLRARNTAGEGAADSVKATPKAPPCTLTLTGPGSVSYAENGAGSVGTYTAGASNCGSLTWSRSGSDASAFGLSGSGSSRSLRFNSAPDYETKTSYRVTVQASAGSVTASRSVTVTVTDVNEAPSVSGPPTASRPENGQAPWTVATYTASDPDGDTIRWSRGGAQAGFFQLTGSGTQRKLAFVNQPDFEARSDYKVEVIVRDRATGGLRATAKTTVTLLNRDDPGVVSFSDASPEVGQDITARLRDGDGGVRSDSWSWGYVSSSDKPDAESQRYTVQSGDAGRKLRATVSYTDAHGSGKSAAGSTGVVSATGPGPVRNLTAERGSRRATAKWDSAAANGSPIKHYQYRHRKGTEAWPSWSTLTGGDKTRSKLVLGLSNGSLYTFQVRAVNGVKEGPARSASVTPAGPPGAPTNVTTDRAGGNGYLLLSWGAAPDNGSAVQHYYYRYRKGTGSWGSWYRRAGGAKARSKSWSTFDDGSPYTFQLRARNGVGYGATAQITAPPLGPGGTAREEAEETEDERIPDGVIPEPVVVVVAKPVAAAAFEAAAVPDSLAVTTAPNPFNAGTTLSFELPQAAAVTLTVYNTAGQVVAGLARGDLLTAGSHTREWDGRDDSGRTAASGLYLYRLVAGGQVRVGKLALIR